VNHPSAVVGTARAFVGAALAMIHAMFATLVAALIAEIGAEQTQFAGVLRAATHESRG
jgi:hypothetical protein